MGDRAKHNWTVSDIDVLYRDEAIAVINKPSGMFTHKGFGLDGVDATSLLSRKLEGIKIHTIHRLDRATSGVLVFALTAPASRILHATFAERRVHKCYWALVWGESPLEGSAHEPLLRRRGRAGTVEAKTSFSTLHVTRNPQVGCVSLVQAHPHEGRRHQIRLHLAGLGHPIVGDMRYGRKSGGTRIQWRWLDISRLALHACRLRLKHPMRPNEDVEFEAPLPADFQRSLLRMGFASA